MEWVLSNISDIVISDADPGSKPFRGPECYGGCEVGIKVGEEFRVLSIKKIISVKFID